MFYVGYLVGGMWHDNTRCGLWYWNFNNASSVANGNVGALLLILNYRELMCSIVIFHVLLLSAVIGTSILELACGVLL